MSTLGEVEIDPKPVMSKTFSGPLRFRLVDNDRDNHKPRRH